MYSKTGAFAAAPAIPASLAVAVHELRPGAPAPRVHRALVVNRDAAQGEGPAVIVGGADGTCRAASLHTPGAVLQEPDAFGLVQGANRMHPLL